MSLADLAGQLVHHHIARTTRKTYQTGLKRFRRFCAARNLPMSSVDVDAIVHFLTDLFRCGLSRSTARVYLAGLSHLFRETALHDLCGHEKVFHALAGYGRLCGKTLDHRLPITLDVMKFLKNQLGDSDLTNYSKRLYWCAFCFAFFGFLRIGEFLAPSTRVVGQLDHTLLFRNVTIDNATSVTIHLLHSKSDMTGSGQTIHLNATGRTVCPVRACIKFLRVRPHRSRGREDAFFVFPDASYLCRQLVTAAMKRFLRPLEGSEHFGAHSFRIGAATTAAANNCSDSAIQRAGRWKSNTYRGYIRPSNAGVAILFYPT
ncbi:hypothetical protein BV898_18183 [Hypsibius exemplaris]|uniref:Core-binding (CB) domain-containing protein n=1 Tax=Hypsibius exemplaris TaxID=2072580 RepID=A0A9X6NJB0_HYPEX|nr:hypothetical protein BV898_18183 [Hypsibius exemplaris]